LYYQLTETFSKKNFSQTDFEVPFFSRLKIVFCVSSFRDAKDGIKKKNLSLWLSLHPNFSRSTLQNFCEFETNPNYFNEWLIGFIFMKYLKRLEKGGRGENFLNFEHKNLSL